MQSRTGSTERLLTGKSTRVTHLSPLRPQASFSIGLCLLIGLGALSGCVGPPPLIDDGLPLNLVKTWSWSLPQASGTFIAEIAVHPSSVEGLRISIETNSRAPNREGEILYGEAHWENGSMEARAWVTGLPGDTRLGFRALGNEVVPETDLPNIPLSNPNPHGQQFNMEPPASGRPETLIVVVAAQVDLTQPQPLTATVRIEASDARLRVLNEQFSEGPLNVFYLSEGGFDGEAGSRIQAGVNVAHTSASLSFRTTENTFIWGEGVLEGNGPLGVGSIRIHTKGSREEFTAATGGANGWHTSPFIIRNYGDDWTVDVEFSGEGYLFLLYADLPLRELPL